MLLLWIGNEISGWPSTSSSRSSPSAFVWAESTENRDLRSDATSSRDESSLWRCGEGGFGGGGWRARRRRRNVCFRLPADSLKTERSIFGVKSSSPPAEARDDEEDGEREEQWERARSSDWDKTRVSINGKDSADKRSPEPPMRLWLLFPRFPSSMEVTTVNTSDANDGSTRAFNFNCSLWLAFRFALSNYRLNRLYQCNLNIRISFYGPGRGPYRWVNM